ncbi:conserved membrane protein of unknown function [Rhodovastum atsumiense]|uniref:Uncharacterized protein n=1 Tax=Rhodovastum atsumiense TaxID=504468 RepID=A0A5M6ISF6_9PROT|nr:hypothetical protein [Rhodovastum atsumiense]KAA5610817.1 hypothetical protein F1189_17200 [Rhodovastum atsumiense]CAH2602137.1 conserved membrane protein of unknown function [Rhodovastum atsumiense]
MLRARLSGLAGRMRPRLLVMIPLLALLLAAASGGIDRTVDRFVTPLAPEQARQILQRTQLAAGLAYVTVRALGRVVGVASSTTVNANVGALVNGGASIEIGNILRPFEQLLDSFADVLMASLVCVTIQLVLVDVLDSFALPWVLSIGLGVLAAAILTGATRGSGLRRLAQVLIASALLGKLLLPVSLQATEALSQRFLRDRAAQAELTLNATQAELTAAMPRLAEGAARPWYDPRRLTDGLGALSPDRLADSFSRLAASVEHAVEASLTWMAVFVLQTVVFPLTVAGASVWLVRAALRRRRP